MATNLENKINRIQTNVTAALAAIAEKGVTVPAGSTSDDLAGLVGQITGGVDTETWIFTLEDGTTIEREVAGLLDLDFANIKSITIEEGTVIKITRKSDGVVIWEWIVASEILDENEWETIANVAASGKAANYWNVGDRKRVVFNGTVGSLAFNNEVFFCNILGFDHNANREGTNCIHFQFGHTALSEGAQIAFIDNAYTTTKNSGTWFNMNNTASNTGGWESSRMKTVICSAFIDVLPEELQNVLKTVTKYTDNVGGASNSADNITATTEKIFLLSEYELFGRRIYANSAEQSYQKQYAYYSEGNSALRYRHKSTGTTAVWWLRSIDSNKTDSFCRVAASGVPDTLAASYSIGFAPAFCV